MEPPACDDVSAEIDLRAEPWFNHAGYEGADPPLFVEGRGTLRRAAIGVSLFLVGLVGWSWVFAPAPIKISLEAMMGRDGAPALDDAPIALGPEGWAASLSEEANYSGDAESLPPPRVGDWLYHFPEQGQTFGQFAAQSQNRRTAERHTIYVVHLGHLGRDLQPTHAVTTEFLGAYYDAPTRFLPPMDLPHRAFDDQRGQYDAREILDALAEHIPDDAMGILAITDRDLFIPSVNYVFGLGSSRQRVAVFSTHRFGDDRSISGARGTVLRRSMTVAVHEFGHVLAMRHCTAFRCIMNGTNSMEEADHHTLHLCPVCRRKAELAMRYHRQDRYARLLDFYDKYGFEEESAFVRRRLDPPIIEFLDEQGRPLP